MDHVIVIDENGTVRTLYTDKIDLREFGPLHVERASNVEWDNDHNGWTVQFANGTYLGRPGSIVVFESREEALAAEVEFLQSRM